MLYFYHKNMCRSYFITIYCVHTGTCIGIPCAQIVIFYYVSFHWFSRLLNIFLLIYMYRYMYPQYA